MRVSGFWVVGSCLLVAACSDFQPAKTGSVGGYELQVKTDPSPLMVGGDAAVSFSIRDRINQPVENCAVRFRQHMPGHEMSLDKTFVPMVDEAKVGLYTARSGNFSMGGDWVLEFDFTCGSDHYTKAFNYTLEWPE